MPGSSPGMTNSSTSLLFPVRRYNFSTCPISSSTRVGRPKMETATLSRERPSSTSSTTPLKEANGPSDTLTCSPTSKEIEGLGRSMPSCTWCMMRAASASEIGLGLLSAPRNPVAFGVHFLPAAHLHDLFGRHHNVVEQVIEVALLGLLANRIGNLALKIRIGLDDVPVLVRHYRRLLQPPIPSTRVTNMRMNWSATRKKIEAMATITKTMAVVTAVSRRVGQVTFWPSARTCCRNLNV